MGSFPTMHWNAEWNRGKGRTTSWIFHRARVCAEDTPSLLHPTSGSPGLSLSLSCPTDTSFWKSFKGDKTLRNLFALNKCVFSSKLSNPIKVCHKFNRLLHYYNKKPQKSILNVSWKWAYNKFNLVGRLMDGLKYEF